MVTTRRSTETVNKSFDTAAKSGGVDLLERPASYEKNMVQEAESKKTASEASERMQRNLYKLLNYDRFSEEQMQVAQEAQVETSFADEDIRPTSTTMQFGDDNIEQIREEMNKVEVEQETSYHLNTKGKIAVILYSLVVTVILALIVLNTGLLSSLSAKADAVYADYQAKVQEYNVVVSEIDSISSADYIGTKAQELGMSK